MFLKWMTRRSPTRARISGPGIRSWLLVPRPALGSGRFQPRVKRRYTTVGKTVCDVSYVVPWIASRPLGIMFHDTGTAATHVSRTAACAAAAGRGAAAPAAGAAGAGGRRGGGRAGGGGAGRGRP